VAYFERLRSEMKTEKLEMKKLTTTKKSLLRSSYLIALQISKTKEPFAIGEELIKPCSVAASKEIFGSKQPKNLKMCVFRMTRFKGEL